VNERHFREIEVVLLHLTEARRRVEKAAGDLAKDDADPRLVEALEEAEKEIDRISLRLMQQTYFAVPKEQLTLT
jgi:hypothetical protein